MTNEEKYKYAYRLTSVASTGLSFIEDSLSRIMNDATDMAYLRTFYILLSYNFELILKSRLVMIGNFSNKDSINEELRNLGHDIQKMRDKLGDANLQEIGIKEIIEDNSEYKITTIDNKEVCIENFTKIRYDFLDDAMRIVDDREHERIKEYNRTLTDLILKKSKEKNEKLE
ncbi:MAG: hypothetical protein A3A94_01330 [Candidatus Portnoybacteria bacterium RIFCSPLOWO2_01_FULL_43_11]|uniref:Uncharacterized protein n=4 Tax=Candidatus Portnoyibacteriota TaxID=1817913 RepID=A0A1G2FB59_9BACT|nr:MAG: hypothetical protein A2815_02650 [Candidatus Portnoybacteria bacterium RIFCSPHIGHO2_01_FULL_40_12b]OGZ37222.1 MAG: hypothetical protein A3D38_01640 [Candidatus Portnoybacteria bacterium RIFCSPHIGHO2_02_FULL_40_23]OGZ37887.1 MAG: hypothetical protein A3A94_01330 [Candidatus Portnoybacteria bacterium RIFCSPLOWO2_01_FULL_43_11]OGZ38130.1 MAG: hypothetical protein A3E90_01765 [Candidatus Portnoybacteria bacterium RIFCSPHIGHO2_12_FULL_40_11]OGZ40888.1 MAG: hypothetical protein A3I20_01550 [C